MPITKHTLQTIIFFDKRSYKLSQVLVDGFDTSILEKTNEDELGDNYSYFSNVQSSIQSLLLLLEVRVSDFPASESIIQMRLPEDDKYFRWTDFPEVHVPVDGRRHRVCKTIQANLSVRLSENDPHAKGQAKKIRLNVGDFSKEDIGMPVLSGAGALKGLIVYVGKKEAIVAPFIGNQPDLTFVDQVKEEELKKSLKEKLFLKNVETRMRKDEAERISRGEMLRKEFESALPNAPLSIEKYLKEFLL